MKTIILLIPYFGKWPEWIELYLDTIRKNPTINFLFITDCEISSLENISNVIIHKSSFEMYIERYKAILGSDIQITNPYKICDLRPFFGIIHENDIKHYDFFGWTDVDLLYGDIRSYYSDDILSKYDVLSTHKNRLSGHLALLKNTSYFRKIGYKIYKWKEALQNPNFVGIDEHGITNALTMTFWDKVSEKFNQKWISKLFFLIQNQKTKRYYFIEQFTTPFISMPWIDGTVNSQHPDVWYYKDGEITNNRDGDRRFIYLHFMNFKSSTWRHDGTKAPWESLNKICYCTPNDMIKGIKIDSTGIHPA